MVITKTDDKISDKGMPSNAIGFAVEHAVEAMSNTKATTLTKAAGGIEISHNFEKKVWTEKDKSSHLQIESISRMAKANTLGKHPSVVTYGWHVNVLSAADLDTKFTADKFLRSSTLEKPFKMHTVGFAPDVVIFSEKGGLTVDAKTGFFTKESKMAAMVPFMVSTADKADGEVNGM